MGKIIGWIAIIVIGLAIWGNSTAAKRDDSGEVIESGNVDVFKIKFGDCLTEDGLNFVGEQSKVSDATAVPCNEPHMFQAYYLGEVSFSSYPSDISQRATEICYREFQNYFGISLDETALTFTTLYPTPESWKNGDREVTCLLLNYDESLLTESLI